MSLPDFPLQRLRRGRPELESRPLVLYAPARHGAFRVVTCTAEARRAGVTPGLSLAEARALLTGGPEPHYARHDPQADLAELKDLARWSQQFSPYVGVESSDAPESLLLDTGGVDHLFGGEQGLAAHVVRAFRRRGYRVRVAIADTIGAAHAVTHYVPACGLRPVVIPPGCQRRALDPLPVEALRLPEAVAGRLRTLGLAHVGQLHVLPRESLPSRFGSELSERLDQSLGRLSETFLPHRPANPIEAEWALEEPVTDRAVLEAVSAVLLERIAAQLHVRREGVLRLWCCLTPAGSGGAAPEPVNVTVELCEPRACSRYLHELLRLRWERIALPAEIRGVRLLVTEAGVLRCRQRELFESDAPREGERQLARVVERVSSRLGPRAVLRPHLCRDHQPEHAARYEPVLWERQKKPARKKRPQRNRARPALPRCALSRPLRLLSRPVPVEAMSVVPDGPPLRVLWGGRDHALVRTWGPERITTGWWRARDVRRDYFRAETADGRRLWVYRDLREGGWFVHGFG